MTDQRPGLRAIGPSDEPPVPPPPRPAREIAQLLLQEAERELRRGTGYESWAAAAAAIAQGWATLALTEPVPSYELDALVPDQQPQDPPAHPDDDRMRAEDR